MNKLISKNPVLRFKLGKKLLKALNGISFKLAWNNARNKKLRYFNWTDANGVTRMYNSKAAGNDSAYESFADNMNEMSAQLPTDRQPKHLGWDRNNPTSSELRGGDRMVGQQGTESMLPGVTVIGTRRTKKPTTTARVGVNKNKATRNMSGAWGQGSGGGLQYANQRQYAFERSDFDKMRMKSSGIFGSTAYQTDNRGKRYVERDGVLYYDDGSYYNPLTRKTGRYTFTPGGLFSKNVFTLYKLGGILPSRNIVERFKNGGVLKFQNAGSLPTAPKAEDRYKKGRKEITIVHPYDVMKFGFRGTRPIRKVNSGSASISEIIRDTKDGTTADTMYYEIPNHLPLVNVQPRYSFSYGNLSSKYGFNPEFNTLKRRFNTAWNLAK